MNQIKKFRKIAGFTQAELAEKLDVSQITVSKWETGRSFPSVKRLRTVADVLGTKPQNLIDDEARAI